MYHGPYLLWDPAKKGQWALQVYSIADFDGSWLEWLQISLLQMIWNDFKWLQLTKKLIWSHLQSFKIIWSHEVTKLAILSTCKDCVMQVFLPAVHSVWSKFGTFSSLQSSQAPFFVIWVGRQSLHAVWLLFGTCPSAQLSQTPLLLIWVGWQFITSNSSRLNSSDELKP